MSLTHSSPDSPARKKPKMLRSFDVHTKLRIVDEVKSKRLSVHAAHRKYGVHQKSVRTWIKQEAELCNLRDATVSGGRRKRCGGAGRPLTYEHLDEELAEWVREQRRKKLKVSRLAIVQKSLKLFNPADDENGFKASHGWLERFLKRHKFTLRVPTTVCQKPPLEYASKIADFVVYVSQIRQENSYHYIYAADETAVWLDPSGGKTVEEIGSREVSVLTTGHDKARVTVLLTARHDGKKCKPYVLLPRVRPDKRIIASFGGKLHLSWGGTSWMNDNLTSDYLRRVFPAPLFDKSNRLLVWDSFRCHLSEATKEQLQKLRLHTAVVPGGCTKFIQPADVAWNAPFKAAIRRSYDMWISNDANAEWTAGGNRRAPSMDVYLQWVVDAWDSLSEELISKSFKECGITNSHDGAEDGIIHAFKAHGPIPEGGVILRDARWLAKRREDPTEEPDPDEDAANNYFDDEPLEITFDGADDSR